jgi:D-serine deaminase-like pyridoxal phosphate-dependent protein
MQQPSLSRNSLKADFVGKRLDQLQTPAAVLDRAIIKRNCTRMLEACSHLGVLFRPHVKTHKVNPNFLFSLAFVGKVNVSLLLS